MDCDLPLRKQQPAIWELASRATNDGVGLVCPRCNGRDFRVIYTRRQEHDTIVRRRECRHCGRRITTRERVIG